MFKKLAVIYKKNQRTNYKQIAILRLKQQLVSLIKLFQFAEHWIRSYVKNNGNPGEYFNIELPGKNGDSNRNDVILENYRTTISANLLLFYILPEELKKGKKLNIW